MAKSVQSLLFELEDSIDCCFQHVRALRLLRELVIAQDKRIYALEQDRDRLQATVRRLRSEDHITN